MLCRLNCWVLYKNCVLPPLRSEEIFLLMTSVMNSPVRSEEISLLMTSVMNSPVLEKMSQNRFLGWKVQCCATLIRCAVLLQLRSLEVVHKWHHQGLNKKIPFLKNHILSQFGLSSCHLDYHLLSVNKYSSIYIFCNFAYTVIIWLNFYPFLPPTPITTTIPPPKKKQQTSNSLNCHHLKFFPVSSDVIYEQAPFGSQFVNAFTVYYYTSLQNCCEFLYIADLEPQKICIIGRHAPLLWWEKFML